MTGRLWWGYREFRNPAHLRPRKRGTRPRPAHNPGVRSVPRACQGCGASRPLVAFDHLAATIAPASVRAMTGGFAEGLSLRGIGAPLVAKGQGRSCGDSAPSDAPLAGSASRRLRPLDQRDLSGSERQILLKNSPPTLVAAVSGVLGSLTEWQSSILGCSERSSLCD